MGTDVTRAKMSSTIYFWVIGFTKGLRTLVIILWNNHKRSIRRMSFLLDLSTIYVTMISFSSRACTDSYLYCMSVMVNYRWKLNQRDRGGESAGPGEYPIKGSVGKQSESQRATLPAFSFPLGTREARDKVPLFISVNGA
jgi:hypothetical protein